MDMDVKSFIRTYIKCLIILIFMGIILPKVFEIGLNYFAGSANIYENSKLVYKSINKQIEILYNYLHLFMLFLI